MKKNLTEKSKHVKVLKLSNSTVAQKYVITLTS